MDADRFRGCLIGQALGDALGFAVEGQPRAVCQQYVDELRAGRPRGRGRFPFGQYTDDTQLARELVQSMVATGGFDAADYGRRVAAIFGEERIVGRGRATEGAAARLAAGVPWHQAGAPPPSAGNGSAMRAGPVGLFGCADPGRLVRVAVDQGRVTHQDPRCSAGAVAIAGAVARALRPEPIDAHDLAAELAGLMVGVDAGFAALVRTLPRWVELPPAEAVHEIAPAGRDFDDGWPGISPFVIGSVLWSLYAFLRAPDDYLAAVLIAIAVGGDVDTTAAMTGAIAGARVGHRRLPAWAAEVTDQGSWDHDALVDLADELHALVVG